LAGGLLALAVLAACGSSAAGSGSSTGAGQGGGTSGSPATATGSADATDGTSGPGRKISVVASTNVWGDVAAAVGGDLVAIQSFISNPNQDPHSFEASPRAQLALSQAALIIENGGGYDDFVDTMYSASGSKAPLINAVKTSGKAAPPGGSLNEHVWYDFPTVGAVAAEVAARLSTIDPSAAATFGKNLEAFQRQLDGLSAAVAAIKAAHAGEPVAITEPVPLYLLQAAGLVNQTPPEFSEAIEEGSDVPVRALSDTLALFTGHRVKLLAYNAQTTGSQSDQVIKAAQDAGIPTIPVTETVPAGKDYVTWMQTNIAAVSKALGG
jgi:zinc/manganese transport system substrate-binding protein